MKPILPIGRLFSLLVLSLFSLLSQAQKTPEQISATRQHVLNDKKVKAVEISAVRQTPSLISFDEKKGSYSKNQASEVLVNYLQLRTGLDALLQDRETELFGNIEVLEFQQYFKGIKVDRAKFKALSKNGKVQFFNGAWYNVPASLSVQPKMDKSKALDHAIGRVNAKKYAWQEYQELRAKNIGNAAVLRALEKEKSEFDPKGELVIVENFNKEGIAEVQLAYKFDIYAVEPLSRAWIYVGANTGEILLVDPIIKHANNPSTSTSSVSTTVQTRYSGLRTINVLQLSGNDPNSGLPIIASNPLESYIPGALTYALVDNTKGGGIETYDLNGVGGLPLSIAPSYSQGKSFTDVDNNWTLAEHKRGSVLSENAESENDDFAWDAHWGAGVVYDYWKLIQNRLSFDGKDAKIKSFIHSGIGYDNAFWNGRVMTYGDGSYTAARNTGFRPLTSLDVCAHEIGHGVCTFTADLVYAKNQVQ